MVKILHGLKNDLGDDGLMILDPSLAMLCYASMKIQLLYAALQEPLSLKRNLTATETVDGFQILLIKYTDVGQLGISYYGMSEFENLLSEVNTSFFNPLMDLPDWLK
ncbi:hypothetical protein N7510_009090 [Penicillium lagena]|uniref:uncharacterized protein n=1 Tax=Penicillium lagena TaxID=94218 RepID=UPI002541033D|nr:uncharacterized protein N7510_009090 [Penicillium lagena]KAJ5606309.1 hypothetical protein N7510_009090 [Penicillium lagena]